MKRMLSFILLLSIIVIAGCTNQEKVPKENMEETHELLISAAASLTDAMTEIVSAFEEEHPDTKITVNYGGSGKLAQQLQQGAPVDVFLSADQAWMDKLDKEQLILPDSKIDFARNELVMIAKEASLSTIDSMEDLTSAKVDQIAIGNPDSVPAGKYAEEALKNSGLWKQIQEKFIYAKDVRQVLTYVETGNADIGFVYGSDLHRTEDVEVVTRVNESLFEPIVYPAAVVASSDNTDVAKAFVAYLESDTVQAILEKTDLKYKALFVSFDTFNSRS